MLTLTALLRLALLLAAVIFGLLQTTFARAEEPEATFRQLNRWSCGGFQRVTDKYLYEAGLTGTKKPTSMTFLGCAQQEGGLDFGLIGFVPFEGIDGKEIDIEAGHTWIWDTWSVRVGIGYWNIAPEPGVQVHILDSRVQINYLHKLWEGVAVQPWVRFNNQERWHPTGQDNDVHIGAGVKLMADFGTWAKLAVDAGHFWHIRSFGPGQHVTVVTGELLFSLGSYQGFAVSAGPWARATWGSIFAPTNQRNQAAGFKLVAWN
jgi:hypothetical protein